MCPKGQEFDYAKGVGSNPPDRIIPARLTPFDRVEKANGQGLREMPNLLIGGGVDGIVPGRILCSNE